MPILKPCTQAQARAKGETKNRAYQVDAQKNNDNDADDHDHGEDKKHDCLVLGGALVAGIRRTTPVSSRAHATVCGLGVGAREQVSATHDSP